MANEEGVTPPPTNPPDTRFLDARIDARLAAAHGGGGTGEGSGPGGERLAKVEAEITHINGTLREINETLRSVNGTLSEFQRRVSTVEADIRHLPSKGFIVTTVVGALALLGAILLFQHQIQQLTGIAPINGK